MAQRITSAKDIKQLGSIMAVWAHPDDESILAGGLLSTAVDNGQTVVCVTATKGEAGSQDLDRWPLIKQAAVRAKEMKQALKILGIKYHYWLDCLDGKCDTANSQEIVSSLLELAKKYKPDTFVTFGPEGFTGHPDHCCVSGWVDEVVKHLDYRSALYHAVMEEHSYRNYFYALDKSLNIFFHIDKPPLTKAERCDLFFRLPKETAKRKSSALRAMPSQYENLFARFDEDFINDACSVEAFIKAK